MNHKCGVRPLDVLDVPAGHGVVVSLHAVDVLVVADLLGHLVLMVVMQEGLVSEEHLLAVLVGVSDRAALAVQQVDLLKRESLGLGNLQKERRGSNSVA